MEAPSITPEFQALIIKAIFEGFDNVKSKRPNSPDDLVNESKAAEILGLAKGTLNIWRHEGKGPKYVKLEGAVRYKYSDLLAYINQRSIKGGGL